MEMPQAGIMPVKEVKVGDLPLNIVITCRVYDVDLPRKEFSGEEEFEEYLRDYAGQKYKDPAARSKFIKRHLNGAIYREDEIVGDRAWQFNGEVRLKNARSCGFGILKTQSGQFYMFQTGPGQDLTAQLAAYQAMTYGFVNSEYIHLFTESEGRKRLRLALGLEAYEKAVKALGLKV